MAKTELDVGPSARFLIFPILIAVSLAFIGYAILQGAPQHLSLIMVSASGSVTAVPTQAQAYLSLNATAATASGAVANLSVITGALNTTLLPFLNGNSSAIQTQSYNVYVPSRCVNATPYYYPQPNCIPQGAPVRYLATESLLVTFPSVGNVNEAIVQIANIHGVSIGSISSKLSAQQQTSLEQQALSLALSNATSQAGSLSGGAAIRVQNITVQNGYIFYPNGVFSAAALAKTNQTFFAGTATVTKSIYVVFSMH
ncbi:MAG: SIMPL domain-containing protein [Candidatus Micrarchaeota archaeon]|nr:SIMPL domain-containing protein [Candidatus Micrarchaeota archaeon]